MQKTDNYELNLPEAEDFFNVEDFNDNTKKIDEVLESLENPEHDTGKQAEVEELASGESLKVALRKLAKAVKDLISHLADKVVHITSDERTLWNTVSNKANSNHTHKYAGSSSAGGAATTALACTGNSATATKLQTARKINGVEFDGTANITIKETDTSNTGSLKCSSTGWYRLAYKTNSSYYIGTLNLSMESFVQEHYVILLMQYGGTFKFAQLHGGGHVGRIEKLRVLYSQESPYGNDIYIDFYCGYSAGCTLKAKFTNQISGSPFIMGENLVEYTEESEIPDGYVSKEFKLSMNYPIQTDAVKTKSINIYADDFGETILNSTNATAYNITVNLPSTSGTLALTTDNVASATKLQTSRTLTIGNKGKSFNGSSDVSWSLSEIGAAPANHTHNYAGSSSAGGAANSANKLNTNAGSATQPVYFKDGIPVATTYTLGKSVPSDAVFTDTKYTHPTTAGNKHIPAGGSSGQMLKWSSDGTAAWTSEINATKATQDGNGNNIVNTYALKHIYDDSSINLGRRANTTVGTESVALGSDVTASGNYSHAEGFATTASGTYSRAEGYFAKASETCSHAEGHYTTASGTSSHAEGTYTTALDYQHAQGHYNDTTLAVANSKSGTSDGTAFVIGNGTSTAKSNAFRITGKGVTYAKGAYNSTGADYAEFAEWADGNPNNEDRRGYFVTFDEEKTTMIRKANAGDYVLGIVSGNPCIIGNADEGWLGKYVFDEFGSIVYEDVEVEETYTDETGEEKTRTVKVNTYKINPEYDPTREYIHREKRKEWAAIGWIGVLSVRDDNTCKAGGYCNVTDGGIATAAERGIDTYRVLERVTDNIVKVAIK